MTSSLATCERVVRIFIPLFGTGLISLSFVVGIKRSVGRSSRLCSGFWVTPFLALLMEHFSLDFWTRQTLRSRVRFLTICLTFSQLSEHQSQSVILHWSSNRNLQLSGSLHGTDSIKRASLSSHQSSLCRRVSVVIISQFFKSMERVQLGFGVTRVISLPTPQILLIGRGPLRSLFSCLPLE